VHPKSFAGEQDQTMIEFSVVNNSPFFCAANTYSRMIGAESPLDSLTLKGNVKGRRRRRPRFPPFGKLRVGSFAKGAKDGAPTLLFMDAKSKSPPLRLRAGSSLQRAEGRGRGTRALPNVGLIRLSGSLLLRVECRQKKFQKRLIRERVLA
jgi:hypothetical protein